MIFVILFITNSTGKSAFDNKTNSGAKNIANLVGWRTAIIFGKTSPNMSANHTAESDEAATLAMLSHKSAILITVSFLATSFNAIPAFLLPSWLKRNNFSSGADTKAVSAREQKKESAISKIIEISSPVGPIKY